jgi:hypothetical protein
VQPRLLTEAFVQKVRERERERESARGENGQKERGERLGERRDREIKGSEEGRDER